MPIAAPHLRAQTVPAVWKCATAGNTAERATPDLTVFSAAAKVFASDTAMSVTTDAVQLFGGAGYTKDFPVERFLRDAKLYDIGAGTNEIRRFLIGRELIGL